ncbi:MAG: hypothetical protein ACRDA4_07400 [Filifactoraceae bacterium]
MKLSKKIIFILSVLSLILGLTACSTTSESSEASKYMDEFITTFKSGDFPNASAMTQDPNFIFFQVAEDPTFTVASQQKAIEMMKALEYKYIKETTTDDKTTLEMEFTVKNVGDLFTEGMRASVMKNLEITGQNLPSQEVSTQVGQAFESAFNKEASTHKENVTVELKKTDSGYTIVPTGELLNMLMGNLLRSQQQLSQALSEVTPK